MAERKLDLTELAGRVSDGERIDWTAAEESASGEDERRVVRHLRLVESVAEVHRSQVSVSARDPLEMSRSVASTLTGEKTLFDSEPPEPAPERWGGLEIRDQIGAGAFGEVFRAWDPNLDREVALKLLKREPSAHESLASTVIREGRLLARVRHPNVVTVHGAETHDGRVGLWMEYVEGRSLADLLREQGKLGAREASLIGLDLCRALAAVHGAGLVHRDIKGRNVMREEGGRILLMDFGAGRDLHDLEATDDRTISGTPLYIAPEVYEYEPASARSDIYSVGVLLFHLVTGRYPVQALSLDDLKAMHRRGEMRLLRDVRSDLPEAFVKVVERALERDPTKRFSTAGEMERALSDALGVEGAPAVAPQRPAPSGSRLPAWPVAAIVTLVIVALFVIWVFPTPMGDEEVAPVPTTAAADGPQSEARPETLAEPVVPTPHRPSAAEEPAAAPAVTYTVEAGLYRVGGGRRERLESGSRVKLKDLLSLELQASRELYVYVINEDEQGEAWALFPKPLLDLQNPLAANTKHVLPGRENGVAKSWEVTSQGGREHFLVVASPQRLIEFEAEMAKLPRPRDGQMAVQLPESARARLRGIGGLTDAPEEAPAGTAGRLFEMADKLAAQPERVEGAWVRRIELENPPE